MGRPPLDLTLEAIEEIISYLEEGWGIKGAADMVGITAPTLRKWIRTGMQDVNAGRDTKHAESTLRFKRAMAMFRGERITQLKKAGENPAFWASAAWLLERMYPEEFGRQDKVNMQLSGGAVLGNINANLEISEEEKSAVLSLLSRIGSGSQSDSGDDGGFGDETSSEDFDVSIP